MSDNTYAITELVGTSADGLQQAIENAVSRASRTLRNLDWFEITDIRGHLSEGAVKHYQVTMKIGFRYEDDATD